MPEMRIQRFGSHNVNFPPKQLFEKVCQPEKIVESLFIRVELYEEINVAFVIRLTAGERAEHAEPPDAKAS